MSGWQEISVCKEIQHLRLTKVHISLGVFQNFFLSLYYNIKRNDILWFKIVYKFLIVFVFSSAANDTMDHLDLSWNHLRNKGACAVALSLKVRQVITTSISDLQPCTVVVLMNLSNRFKGLLKQQENMLSVIYKDKFEI